MNECKPLKPGMDTFDCNGGDGFGLGVASGVIPIIPSRTGVGSPPFVVRFSQTGEGKNLAIADEEGMVTIVNAAGKLPGLDIDPDFRPFQWTAHDNAIFDVAWCHDDQRMLTASGDQTVRLWDVETGVNHCSFRRHQAGADTRPLLSST